MLRKYPYCLMIKCISKKDFAALEVYTTAKLQM